MASGNEHGGAAQFHIADRATAVVFGASSSQSGSELKETFCFFLIIIIIIKKPS